VRALKWVSFGLGCVLALVLVGVLVVVWLVDPNRFKPRIEQAVREATGREFALTGDIELGFFPWLALRAGAGRFGNAPGFGSDPMVKWRGAQLGVKLLPLLRGELVADRVHLQGLDLRLIRHADGKANWQGIGASQPAPEKAGDETRFSVDGVEIEDSHISFVDETVPRHVEIAGFDFVTDQIELGAPFTDTSIAGVLHMDGFARPGLPFKLEVPRAALARDFTSLEVKEFALKLGALEMQGAVRGTFGARPRLDGHLTTDEFDVKALLATLGVAAPKTTDPQAFGKVSLAGSWRFDAGAIAIEPLAFQIDDTRFTGKFERGAGEDPVATLELAGNALDIARYMPPSDPASEPFVLPTAALKALKFRGKIELEQARYADTLMKGVTLRLLLDEQGLRGEPRK
jgi:AsmA protein